ncbi:MAG: NAD(P)H-binding protein [Polyangiales bacterium]
MERPQTALLAGASGLVGGHLLDLLLEGTDPPRVVSLGRRAIPRTHPALTQQTVDFANLGGVSLPAADLAFCGLGTTIKRAGSREAFRAVDHDAVVAFATAARAAGVRHFLVVTALGADAGSSVFYNRVKGEVENSLKSMGFEALTIAQPSLLLGDREESRPAEHAAVVVSRALAPVLGWLASRPIEARDVAKALVRLSTAPTRGVRVVTNAELHALAR